MTAPTLGYARSLSAEGRAAIAAGAPDCSCAAVHCEHWHADPAVAVKVEPLGADAVDVWEGDEAEADKQIPYWPTELYPGEAAL